MSRQEEADELLRQSQLVAHCERELERLGRVNVYNDVFSIWHDGALGTISALRLGTHHGAETTKVVKWVPLRRSSSRCGVGMGAVPRATSPWLAYLCVCLSSQHGNVARSPRRRGMPPPAFELDRTTPAPGGLFVPAQQDRDSPNPADGRPPLPS